MSVIFIARADVPAVLSALNGSIARIEYMSKPDPKRKRESVAKTGLYTTNLPKPVEGAVPSDRKPTDWQGAHLTPVTDVVAARRVKRSGTGSCIRSIWWDGVLRIKAQGITYEVIS